MIDAEDTARYLFCYPKSALTEKSETYIMKKLLFIKYNIYGNRQKKRLL